MPLGYSHYSIKDEFPIQESLYFRTLIVFSLHFFVNKNGSSNAETSEKTEDFDKFLYK